MRKQLIAGSAVGLLACLGIAAPASALSDTSADLYVLHAVPDTEVDVYVNGALTLDNFAPGAMAGPLDLPAGNYVVAITAANAADASAPVIGPITLNLAAATSYTAVAHLAANGTPSATLFTNDIAPTEAGKGRLTVRHAAAAPTVDILAGGSPVAQGLSTGDEATLNLDAGVVSAAVALAGQTAPVLGPADVEVKDGVLTIVYAWGSAQNNTLKLAVQTIEGLHSAPTGVNTGSAGLAADTDTAPIVWAGSALLALLAAAGLAFSRRSRLAAVREARR